VCAKKQKTDSGNLAAYLFHEGTNFRAYRYLGAHFCKEGVIFRVWAPNAASVSVVGDFNGWDHEAAPMKRVTEQGVWETLVENAKEFDGYKFAIVRGDGSMVLKADPYAVHAETRPATASKLYRIDGYEWHDKKWLKAQAGKNPYKSPMNIYEVQLGSWKKHPDGSFYSYRQMAEDLVPYVKKMGYTHIEFLPLNEYPYDGSWGYQVTGYYAATSRYGTPKDLMYLVDVCHQNGIGVLLDWVPAHFPKDAHGLYEFDGTCLYEYSDPLKREHSDWGTRIFDYGRNEVRCFLVSSAMFWMEYFHLDGIRVDAVASMLYLDYGKQGGEWRPNQYGGNENLEAISFLQTLNSNVATEYPSALMIAEESTMWPLVTKPPYDGGLGFHFKWNMGWMNDSLRYFSTDPIFRKHHHGMITHILNYAFSENYILPLSHDEVVHGKCSLINKQPGDYDAKFASLRAMMAYMMFLPGKKLSFMGNEFGQFIEWNENRELDWLLLAYPAHQKHQEYIRALNQVYLSHSELWQKDDSEDGFTWLISDDYENNIFAFLRENDEGSRVMVVLNLAPVLRENYRIGIPATGLVKRVFTSDSEEFGGQNIASEIQIPIEEIGWNGKTHSVSITVPPMSATLFYVPNKTRKKAEKSC